MHTGEKSRGPLQQFLVQRDDSWYKVALCDKVPGDDVERADSGAGSLLLHPAQQRGIRGHHQVLQGLRRVRADVFQVLCQVNSCDEETSWSAMLFPVLKRLNKSLSSAFVGPPVRNMRPQVDVAAGHVVFIGHNDRAA